MQIICCGKQRWSLKLLMLVALMMMGTSAWGQKTGPRPGEEDPLGNPSRYNLFPDQELLAVLAHDPATGGLNPEFSFNSFAPSADLKTLTPLGGATNLAMDLNAPHMGAAAGRILASDREQIVYARRTGSSLAVAFLGYPNSITTLAPLANQLPDSADVFDIAVGDLDKRADLDGNNHDEVVVCFATTPNYAVRVAVLDYTVSAPAPADAAIEHPLAKPRLRSGVLQETARQIGLVHVRAGDLRHRRRRLPRLGAHRCAGFGMAGRVARRNPGTRNDCGSR
jgi:hypothetical protein